MRALSAICILGSIALGQRLPETMIKLAVRLERPDVAKESSAAQLKLMYRAGSGYCRSEEVLDHEDGIHGLMIVNEPDAWLVNLHTMTAQHVVDPGPTFICHLPIFRGQDGAPTDMKNPILSLEFGQEIAYFKAKGANPKQGPILRGKLTNIYAADAGRSQLFLFVTGTPEHPWAVARQHDGEREIVWYGTYEQVPFDAKLFGKPGDVKIKDGR
jgi:hypothetical protein